MVVVKEKRPVNIVLILALVLLSLSSNAAVPQKGLPLLTAGDIPKGGITGTHFYEGKGLYGFIDGGAEIYLEYGFVRLALQKVQEHGEDFSVEICQMMDSSAAFGIFSISQHRCVTADSLTITSCVSRFAVQFAAGPYYVRVINSTGSARASASGLVLARAIVRHISDERMRFPSVFQAAPFQQFRPGMKYVVGRLGIQNGCPEWSEYLDGLDPFRIFILPIDSPEGSSLVSTLHFARSEDVLTFCHRAGISLLPEDSFMESETANLRRMVWHTRPLDLLFLETSLPLDRVRMFRDALNNAARNSDR